MAKTGTGNSGGTKLDGVKRGAQNVISQIENNRLLVADFEKQSSGGPFSLGRSPAQPMEGLIAPGDSGGGLFITTPAGTYLAGVNSFVGSDFGAPRSVFGNFSGHTRVSAYRDWIEAHIRGNDEATVEATVEEPKQADAKIYPALEPGSLILLGAAGMLLWLSRRVVRRA